MRKLGTLLIIAAAALLAACSGGTTASPNAATPANTTAVPTENPSAVKMECRVVGSLVATPDTTLAVQFPASEKGDWTRGQEGATLNIIEYSDFL